MKNPDNELQKLFEKWQQLDDGKWISRKKDSQNDEEYLKILQKAREKQKEALGLEELYQAFMRYFSYKKSKESLRFTHLLGNPIPNILAALPSSAFVTKTSATSATLEINHKTIELQYHANELEMTLPKPGECDPQTYEFLITVIKTLQTPHIHIERKIDPIRNTLSGKYNDRLLETLEALVPHSLKPENILFPLEKTCSYGLAGEMVSLKKVMDLEKNLPIENIVTLKLRKEKEEKKEKKRIIIEELPKIRERNSEEPETLVELSQNNGKKTILEEKRLESSDIKLQTQKKRRNAILEKNEEHERKNKEEWELNKDFFQDTIPLTPEIEELKKISPPNKKAPKRKSVPTETPPSEKILSRKEIAKTSDEMISKIIDMDNSWLIKIKREKKFIEAFNQFKTEYTENIKKWERVFFEVDRMEEAFPSDKKSTLILSKELQQLETLKKALPIVLKTPLSELDRFKDNLNIAIKNKKLELQLATSEREEHKKINETKEKKRIELEREKRKEREKKSDEIKKEGDQHKDLFQDSHNKKTEETIKTPERIHIPSKEILINQKNIEKLAPSLHDLQIAHKEIIDKILHAKTASKQVTQCLIGLLGNKIPISDAIKIFHKYTDQEISENGLRQFLEGDNTELLALLQQLNNESKPEHLEKLKKIIEISPRQALKIVLKIITDQPDNIHKLEWKGNILFDKIKNIQKPIYEKLSLKEEKSFAAVSVLFAEKTSLKPLIDLYSLKHDREKEIRKIKLLKHANETEINFFLNIKNQDTQKIIHELQKFFSYYALQVPSKKYTKGDITTKKLEGNLLQTNEELLNLHKLLTLLKTSGSIKESNLLKEFHDNLESLYTKKFEEKIELEEILDTLLKQENRPPREHLHFDKKDSIFSSGLSNSIKSENFKTPEEILEIIRNKKEYKHEPITSKQSFEPLKKLEEKIDQLEKLKYPSPPYTCERFLTSINGEKRPVTYVTYHPELTPKDTQTQLNIMANIAYLVRIETLAASTLYSLQFWVPAPEKEKQEDIANLLNLLIKKQEKIIEENKTDSIDTYQKTHKFILEAAKLLAENLNISEKIALKHIKTFERYYLSQKQQPILVTEIIKGAKKNIQMDIVRGNTLTTKQQEEYLKINDKNKPKWFNKLSIPEQEWYKLQISNGNLKNLNFTSEMQQGSGLKNFRDHYLFSDIKDKITCLSKNTRLATIVPMYIKDTKERKSHSELNAEQLLDHLAKKSRKNIQEKWGKDTMIKPTVYVHSLLSPLRFDLKLGPDTKMTEMQLNALNKMRKNEKYSDINIVVGNDPLNFLRFLSAKNQGWNATDKLIEQANIIFKDVISPTEQQTKNIMLMKATIAQLENLKGLPFSNKSNRRVWKAALEEILVEAMGGEVSANCKSGKDRTGLLEIIKNAMVLHYQTHEKLPAFPATDDFLTIFKELYESCKIHESAALNAPGAFGIKDKKASKVLDKVLFTILGLSYSASDSRANLNKTKEEHSLKKWWKKIFKPKSKESSLQKTTTSPQRIPKKIESLKQEEPKQELKKINLMINFLELIAQFEFAEKSFSPLPSSKNNEAKFKCKETHGVIIISQVEGISQLTCDSETLSKIIKDDALPDVSLRELIIKDEPEEGENEGEGEGKKESLKFTR